MPIITRFASVQDPNTPPNVDFSQGIMQAALAGAQLRRMGVEEKQGEAALGMQREGLDMRKQEFGLRQQEYQRGLDLEADAARAGEFMMNLRSQPRPPQGQPLAPGAAGPKTLDPMQAETMAAAEFAKSLKTDAAKAAFTDQFRQYQQGMVIQQNAQQTQARLQDALIAFGETPEAAPFIPELEAMVGQLDMLDGLPPEQQAKVLDAVTSKLGGVREAAMSEITRKRAKMESVATLQQLAGQYPATTQMGQALRQIGVAVELGGMDPEEGVKRAYGVTMDMVPDPKNPNAMVSREYAEKVKLRQFEDQLESATDAAARGVPKTMIREAMQGAKMIMDQAAAGLALGEGQPITFADAFAEALAVLQLSSGGLDSAIDAVPTGTSGSAQGASGPQPEPEAKQRPQTQPAPSQSFLSAKAPELDAFTISEMSRDTPLRAAIEAERRKGKNLEQARKDALAAEEERKRGKGSVRSRTRGIGG